MVGMALLMAFSAFAAPKGKTLLYRSLSDFVLMYPTASEPEDGKKVAEYFARVIEKKFDVKLEVVSDSLRHSQPEIMVGQTDRGLSQRFYDAPHTLYDYAVHTDGRNIALCGGGAWALEKSFRLLFAFRQHPRRVSFPSCGQLQSSLVDPECVAL